MILENEEYYIEIDDIINNSEFTDKDLTDVYGEKIEWSLKDASSKVYSIIYGAFTGIDKPRQNKAIRYLINNDEDRQLGLRKAIIEYVRGDLSIGLGLGLYTDKQHYSKEVVSILKRYGMWRVAKIVYRDEDLV